MEGEKVDDFAVVAAPAAKSIACLAHGGGEVTDGTKHPSFF